MDLIGSCLIPGGATERVGGYGGKFSRTEHFNLVTMASFQLDYFSLSYRQSPLFLWKNLVTDTFLNE